MNMPEHPRRDPFMPDLDHRPDMSQTVTMNMPPFDSPVNDGGYQWWYLDASDHEGKQALVVIAFIGSVFSPYYYRARQRATQLGRADPLQYCALNVGLYGRNFKRWSMTERCASQVERNTTRLQIGPSSLQLRPDGTLEIVIKERSAPTGRWLTGRVEVRPVVATKLCQPLDVDGLHTWSPWSPLAQVKVAFDRPETQWSGEAYLDSNRGSEPLEKAFRNWQWSRSRASNGVEVQYDVTRRDGSQSALMLSIDEAGQARMDRAPDPQELRRSAWGIARLPRSGSPLQLARTLEDTPFYTRSLLSIDRPDGPVFAMHESLCLDRFRQAWVRGLLPFRMPRRWWG
jgi:carotenoid 1,2-hydratase